MSFMGFICGCLGLATGQVKSSFPYVRRRTQIAFLAAHLAATHHAARGRHPERSLARGRRFREFHRFRRRHTVRP